MAGEGIWGFAREGAGENNQNPDLMLFVICPQCHHHNDLDALACVSCGERLSGHPEPAPAEEASGTHAPLSPGAIWLDTPPFLRGGPEGEQDTVPMPVQLTLRDVVPARHGAPAAPPAALPVLTETQKPAARRAEKPTVDNEAWLAHDRAAKRALVRRARRRHTVQTRSTDVLVFDRDPASRDRLFGLLTAFGFGVHAADTLSDATELAATHRFVAAFVDVALGVAQDDPGVGLCQLIKGAQAAAGEPPTLLVWVGSRLRPVERVRAELAGCDAQLVKPLSRSDVARVLDSHGIALPADPRQG